MLPTEALGGPGMPMAKEALPKLMAEQGVWEAAALLEQGFPGAIQHPLELSEQFLLPS